MTTEGVPEGMMTDEDIQAWLAEQDLLAKQREVESQELREQIVAQSKANEAKYHELAQAGVVVDLASQMVTRISALVDVLLGPLDLESDDPSKTSMDRMLYELKAEEAMGLMFQRIEAYARQEALRQRDAIPGLVVPSGPIERPMGA